MVPPYSHGIPRAPRYSGYCLLTRPFAYGIFTLYDLPSHTVLLKLMIRYAVRTPPTLLPAVWPLPISLATTFGISVDFFSSPYLDVSVQAVPLIYLFIQYMIRTLLMRGLLHSDTLGSIRACRSPRLFAAYRVLLRLLMPRHPPCALISLNANFFCRIMS